MEDLINKQISEINKVKILKKLRSCLYLAYNTHLNNMLMNR